MSIKTIWKYQAKTRDNVHLIPAFFLLNFEKFLRLFIIWKKNIWKKTNSRGKKTGTR